MGMDKNGLVATLGLAFGTVHVLSLYCAWAL